MAENACDDELCANCQQPASKHRYVRGDWGVYLNSPLFCPTAIFRALGVDGGLVDDARNCTTKANEKADDRTATTATKISQLESQLDAAARLIAQELRAVASWIRTPGNINSDDAVDECARVLENRAAALVGSSRVDLQACKLEYSIVSPK